LGKPTVSVIIPTYNRCNLVMKAITSVLNQTYQDFEIIVVDDCSTDSTEEVVRGMKDPRLLYIKLDSNSGGSYAPRTKALNVSVGKYIAVLDDDSCWLTPGKLELQVNFLETNREYNLVGTNAVSIDANGNVLLYMSFPSGDGLIRKKNLTKSCFLHSSLLYRRSVAVESGGYRKLSLDSYGNYTNDYELWLRLGTMGKVANLPIMATGIVLAQKNFNLRLRFELVSSLLGTIKRYRRHYPNYYRSILYWSLVLLDTKCLRYLKSIVKTSR